MKIILIADGHPREWPILRALNLSYPSAVWIQPVYERAKRSKNNSGADISFHQRLYARIRNKIHREITKNKVGDSSFEFRNHQQIPWQRLNSEQGIELLSSHEPDIIITCRAPILQSDIIEQASICGINIHFGHLPSYRGNDGLFWAMYNDDSDALGGTIHLLDTGVDTGNKLADAFPALDNNSSLIETELAVSYLLGEVLLKLLEIIPDEGASLNGIPQESSGHNYRTSDRNIGNDIRYLFNRLANPPAGQDEQISYYV